jgi:hypothetical protein
MIIESAKNDVVTSNVKDIVSMTMLMTGKAFKIFSDNLYKNKHAAIIRELSCNAKDAYPVNETNKEYHVHLPCLENPVFWIRDFGTGMSEEQMKSVYTTYFSSTKDKTNEFTGCLGLGSKTPFSYTDSFNVISYQNGKAYYYNAFMNPDGIPQLAKFMELDTEERNGFKVEFNVKPNDFRSFHNNAAKIYSFFDNKPTVFSGSEKCELVCSYSMPDFNGKDYVFHNNSLSGEATMIMGSIAYPLYLNQFMDEDDKEVELFHSSYKVMYKCPIGLFDIAPSREEISYDKITIEKLKEFIKGHIKDFVENNIQKKMKDIENAPTMWEAKEVLAKLVKEHSNDFCKKMFEGARWNNEIITSMVKLSYDIDIPDTIDGITTIKKTSVCFPMKYSKFVNRSHVYKMESLYSVNHCHILSITNAREVDNYKYVNHNRERNVVPVLFKEEKDAYNTRLLNRYLSYADGEKRNVVFVILTPENKELFLKVTGMPEKYFLHEDEMFSIIPEIEKEKIVSIRKKTIRAQKNEIKGTVMYSGNPNVFRGYEPQIVDMNEFKHILYYRKGDSLDNWDFKHYGIRIDTSWLNKAIPYMKDPIDLIIMLPLNGYEKKINNTPHMKEYQKYLSETKFFEQFYIDIMFNSSMDNIVVGHISYSHMNMATNILENDLVKYNSEEMESIVSASGNYSKKSIPNFIQYWESYGHKFKSNVVSEYNKKLNEVETLVSNEELKYCSDRIVFYYLKGNEKYATLILEKAKEILAIQENLEESIKTEIDEFLQEIAKAKAEAEEEARIKAEAEANLITQVVEDEEDTEDEKEDEEIEETV